jgi:hypothetical protein
VLGRLKGFDAVDMDQRAKYDSVLLRVCDRDSCLGDRHVFGVANLMDFAIRQSKLKRFERLPVEQVLNRFHIHTAKCTTVDTE